MKILKYLGIGVAAIAILVAVVAAIVAATFDPNDYKPRVIALVKEKYGRTLAIDGDVGLKFFPRIGASVKAVSLSDPGSAKIFAKIGEANVSLAVLPLLARQVIVDRVELSGLDAQLIRYKDGRTNFDDLKGEAAKPQPGKDEKKPAEPGGGKPPVIDISGIAVKDSAVSWRDESAGTDLRITVAELRTGRIASGESGKLVFRGQVKGPSPAVDIAMKLDSGYRFDFARPAAELKGLDATVEGDIAGTPGLKARLSGDLAWGGGNRLDVANLKLDASSKDGLDVKASAPRLAISPERSESSPIEANVKLVRDKLRLNAKVALAAVKSTGQRIEFSSLGLDLDMKDDTKTVQGKLSTPVTLELDKGQAMLGRIAGTFTVAGPDIPNKSVQLALNGSASGNWTKKSLQADIAAKFDETSAKLKLAVADYSKPAPQFDLAIDRLNVDRYTGGKSAAKGGDAKGAKDAPSKDGKGSDDAIDLSALKTLNAAGDIRVGSLVASGVKAESVHVGLKAGGGRVNLSPVTAQLYQGTASGSIGINANTQQFAIRQSLTNIAVGPLLRDAADKDILEGRGTVVLDVTTAGATKTALKRALDGKASLDLRDGAIKGIDLGAIARKARSLRSGHLESAAAAKAEKTDFSELTASFVVKNGVAHNDDFSAKSPFIRVTGSGNVDIGNGALDYLVKASIVATSTGQEGKALADVRGLTFPVKLSGPFDNLKYSVDVSALVKDAATDAVKDELRKRLEERASKGGRLGDALKGLLGR